MILGSLERKADIRLKLLSTELSIFSLVEKLKRTEELTD